MKKLNKKGFTLVELLAVIVVLALLMVVAASSIGSALDNSKKKALLTETQKLVTNISAEAQSLKLMGEVKKADIEKVYNGKDADYTYDVTINSHGYITKLIVCYADYSVSLTDAAVAPATTPAIITSVTDGYTTTITVPTAVDAAKATCTGTVTVN